MAESTSGEPGSRVVLPTEGEGERGEFHLSELRDAALRGAVSSGSDTPEDAVQEAMLDMHRSRVTYDNPAGAAFTIGRRRGIDQLRQDRRRAEVERASSAGSELVGRPFEEQVVAKQYLDALLEIARSELTPREFDGLVSLYESGGTVSDAARQLALVTGRPFEVIRTQIRRAVKKMRDAMGDDDDE